MDGGNAGLIGGGEHGRGEVAGSADHDVVAAGHPVDEVPVSGSACRRGVAVVGLDGDGARVGSVLQSVPQARGAVVAVDMEESDPIGGGQVGQTVAAQQSEARSDADARGDQRRCAAEDPCGPEVRIRCPSSNEATAREPLPWVRTAMRTMSSSTSVIV